MDAMGYLAERSLKMHEVYTSDISLSFCASAYNAGKDVIESIESISTIASELGYPYEIIVVSPHGNRSIRDLTGRVGRNIDNFYHVRQDIRNSGQAMRIGFEASRYRFFIPFSSGTIYDIRYADLIHSFITKREKKLFLSELPVIHRDLVSEAGGYRDLSHGHDIDLYSRIALMYGVIAYPALFNRIPLVSPPPAWGARDGGSDGRKSSLGNLIDHIIACNYEIEDLITLYSGSRSFGRSHSRVTLSLLYAASRLRRLKPFRFDRNNYLILMENIFESLVLKDFARYGVEDIKANMLLTHEEIRYLRERSRLYRDAVYSISQYVMEI